jgi:hypothetical protein
VILFDNVVEVLDLPQFTPFWNGSLGFQLTDGLGIGRIFIDRDHTRGGRMRRSQRFREEAFGCFGITGGTEPEFEGVALRIHSAIEIALARIFTSWYCQLGKITEPCASTTLLVSSMTERRNLVGLDEPEDEILEEPEQHLPMHGRQRATCD